MDFFTQLVYVIGRVTPSGVEMLGTGFLVSRDGVIATTHHVVGSSDANLVILAPHTNDLNAFQDLSDTSCRTIPVAIKEIDPIRDIALLKAEIRIDGQIPPLGSFDADSVGDEIGIFGFPHCVEGRRALTYQKAEIGAKVLLETNGIKSKHAVINTQSRPGQSGSLVFLQKKTQSPACLWVLGSPAWVAFHLAELTQKNCIRLLIAYQSSTSRTCCNGSNSNS